MFPAQHKAGVHHDIIRSREEATGTPKARHIGVVPSIISIDGASIIVIALTAESAAPKEIGLGWGSRGSPIYSAGLCSRAASHTPVAPKSADDCCFLPGFSLHLRFTGSAITLVVSRLQSSF